MQAGLGPIGDLELLEQTRRSWHSVAEHVLAPARYHAEGRIGLAVTPGGFGTPPTSAGLAARVDGADLVVGTTSSPLTTIADAAAALGIEAGAPSAVYTPTTPLTPDARLVIDPGTAAVLASWFALGWSALEALRAATDPAETPSSPTLWPEHFDAAIDLGLEERGARGTFGVSPGDAEHPEPYLYVTHWAEVPDDPYWNDTVFPGASLAYSAVAGSPDAPAAVGEFFARGHATLAAGTASG